MSASAQVVGCRRGVAERGSLPVWSFGVTAPKQVPEGARRRDFGVSGVEHHADVFGDDGRLDAVVQLEKRRHIF